MTGPPASLRSLAQPGPYYRADEPPGVDLGPKLLELLRAVVPKLSRIALLGDPSSTSYRAISMGVQAAARNVGVSVLSVEARSLAEIESAFPMMRRDKIDAVILASTALFGLHRREIVALAMRYRIPSIFGRCEAVEAVRFQFRLKEGGKRMFSMKLHP